MLRLLAVKLALALLGIIEPAGLASRQVGPYQLGWWLKAYGSAQVLVEANHVWAEGFDSNGQHIGRMFDHWLDVYCQIGSVSSGDGTGTPLRIRFKSPSGYPGGCIALGDGSHTFSNQFHGWTNGLGTYSGQNFYSPWYVRHYESYVFPRDASSYHSRGTTVEVF